VLGPFGAPTALASVNMSSADWDPAVTANERMLYFASGRSGGVGGFDIWVASRGTTADPFGTPTNVAELNTASSDGDPEISSGGLTIWFSSTRSGGSGGYDLYRATRASITEAFGAPELITELSTSSDDRDPSLTPDRLTIYFASNRSGGAGGLDIWMASRATAADAFGAPVNVTELNTADREANPEIAADGLTVYFDSDRAGGVGLDDLHVATRTALAEPFANIQNLTALNTTSDDGDAELSADGLTLYFGSARPDDGDGDLYVSSRTCQ
jgi:Tol biopolymer transport system component